MRNSTEKYSKTMQNQSELILDKKYLNSFTNFGKQYLYPHDFLWVDKPPVFTERLHKHNHLELARCVQGCGTLFMDGRIYNACEGDYTIIYEGQFHATQTSKHSQSVWNYLYIDLNFFLKYIPKNLAEQIKGLKWDKYTFPELLSKSDYPEITRLMDLIFEEAHSTNPDKAELLTCYITSILLLHSRHFKDEPSRVNNNNTIQRIAPAIAYVNSNFAEDISIQQLADICYTSVSTLRRDFVAFTGEPPLNYLNEVRLKNALLLLTTTDKKIVDIALECGFDAISSFNRQFKQFYKKSPTQYLKELKK